MSDEKFDNVDEKVKKYKKLTETALKKVKIVVPEEGALREIAEDFYKMAENYFNDASHYEDKDKLTALVAYSYAHAWLDAGARLGLFETKKDYKLFTLWK